MSVTVASIVRDEADRFLPRALKAWAEIADRIVVLDNGSTDGTPDILQAAGVECSTWSTPMDGQEWLARKALFDKAAPGSDWLVHLDADHVPADDFRPRLTGESVAFRVFDMWNATDYRSDAWWHGHSRAWWRAIHVPSLEKRGKPLEGLTWNPRGWHSGHLPLECASLACVEAGSILHYGYATPELREKHHFAYLQRAPVLTQAEIFHAGTIIDMRPALKKLAAPPKWPLL